MALSSDIVSTHSPVRVASLQPSITVTLERLGLLRRVVACTRYCADVVPSVLGGGVHIIQDSWTAKCDEILAVQPDIVIASVPYQLEAVAQILKAGVRFVGFAPKCLDDIYGDIATIAALMGVPERGEALIQEMQAEISWAQDLTRGMGPHPRVFAEEWGKPIIHSQPWVAELVEAAGGEFIGRPGAHTDAKAVAAENPDVILAAWCGAGDRVPLKKIVRDRGWAETNAVRNQRVYCISDELLNTPGPTLTRGLHAILRALHPEHFPASAGVRHIADEL
jgi:iron complex transport system substrate-binding protein